MVEFHPFALYFDEHWTPHYDYFKGDATEEPAGVGDYVAASGTGPARSTTIRASSISRTRIRATSSCGASAKS